MGSRPGAAVHGDLPVMLYVVTAEDEHGPAWSQHYYNLTDAGRGHTEAVADDEFTNVKLWEFDGNKWKELK